jgi:hypothetical protein
MIRALQIFECEIISPSVLKAYSMCVHSTILCFSLQRGQKAKWEALTEGKLCQECVVEDVAIKWFRVLRGSCKFMVVEKLFRL